MNDKEPPKVVARNAGAPRTPPPTQTAPSLLKQRWFMPVVLAALALLAFGVIRLSKDSDRKAAATPPDPQKTGRLVVKSNLTNATVEATRIPPAGEAASAGIKGAADQTLAGLPPGKYAVTARSDGWPEIRQEASVDAGRTTEVALNFKSGSLRLDSDPTGATVRWGETVLGKTPLAIPQLPPGECQLSVEYESWPVLNYKTTITENVETAETVRLPHGKLIVETTPPGATVLLGGKTIGQSPLTLERVSVGPKKLTLQAKDFPTLNVSVTVADRGEAKVSPQLGAYFPELDPAALLRAVWVPDNPDKLAPAFDGISGPSAPRNGIVKNLNRKKLYENWLRQRYHFSATVKAYDPGKGQIEFAEEKSELSKYRILATLSPEARNDKDLAAQLAKGATFALYGQLSAVEEPRWPSKVITLEISAAEPLRLNPEK